MSSEEIGLGALFRRALEAASKVLDLPTLEEKTQTIILSALTDLRAVASRINTLGLFSPNERLDELSTRNIVYILVPYVIGDVQLRVRAVEPDERLESLRSATIALSSFVRLLDDYEVISPDDKKLHASAPPNDPAKRRQMKIDQYKAEKAIKSRVEALRNRRRQSSSVEASNDYELIADLLSNQNLDEGEDEEEVRDLFRTVLRMFWTQAIGHLANVEREVEVLRSAPPKRDQNTTQQTDSASRARTDESWRLDRPLGGESLLDQSGRPLRPFTILPSSAGERARLQAEVFRPDHRLPTMTIDEYLEEEKKRGNFISGGGEASFNVPTSKELLQEAAEMDGTMDGEENSEQKRREEEEWALYTEAHPKGMGNTLNRG